MKIRLAIADDHQLFLKSLSLLIDTFKSFVIVAEALNGKALIEKIKSCQQEPDIVLLDVNMPVMDGRQTAQFISAHHPAIKIIALSMQDDDESIIAMIKAGCCAYIVKDIHPDELEKALYEVYKKGYYNADALNIYYRRMLHSGKQNEMLLNEKEKQFLQLACSDATYKEIALAMKVTERAVDGYRENIFRKLNVQSRTGMALEAIRKRLVTI